MQRGGHNEDVACTVAHAVTTNLTQVQRDAATRMHDFDPVTDVKAENVRRHVSKTVVLALPL